MRVPAEKSPRRCRRQQAFVCSSPSSCGWQSAGSKAKEAKAKTPPRWIFGGGGGASFSDAAAFRGPALSDT